MTSAKSRQSEDRRGLTISFATPAHNIVAVVNQHAEESAHLRRARSVLVIAPHVKLHHLRRLDDRIAAHLDGLAVAGDFGSQLCEALLETPGVGEVFAATVRAIEEKDEQRLNRLFALTAAVPVKGARFKLISKLQLPQPLAGAANARERIVECGIICVTSLATVLISVCPC